MNNQGHFLECRTLLRWWGAATLVLPSLTACASSDVLMATEVFLLETA